MTKYKIPFSKKSMLEYTSHSEGIVDSHWGSPSEWRENSEFFALLRLTGQYRGRSAARITVENVLNRETYSLGFSAFYEAVIAFGVSPGGHIEGHWTFRKQGSNYGLYPVIKDLEKI